MSIKKTNGRCVVRLPNNKIVSRHRKTEEHITFIDKKNIL